MSYHVSTTQGRGPEPGCAIGGGVTCLLHLLHLLHLLYLLYLLCVALGLPCPAPASCRQLCASVNCRTGRRCRSECCVGSVEKKHDSHTASLLPRDGDCLDLFALPLLLVVTWSRRENFASGQEHESLSPTWLWQMEYWG